MNKKMILSAVFLPAMLFLMPMSVHAQVEAKIDSGDTAFVLLSAALVMLMTPGLAMFYGGMARKKNVLGTIMHSFIAIAIVSMQWVLIGYSLSFGPDIKGIIGGLDWAFLRDFERNGPSLFRICDTIFQGWKRYRDFPDARVRERFANDAAKLRTTYDAALWAMEKQLRKTNSEIAVRIRALRKDIEREFGTATRLVRAVTGPILLWTSKREDRRLARGKTYEPPTFVDRRNWAV